MADTVIDGTLRCSFCRQNLEEAGKLISKAGTPPTRAYICPECVRFCYAILEDDEGGGEVRPHANR
jgi:hypothetical protein